jgi:hypothetical protein
VNAGESPGESTPGSPGTGPPATAPRRAARYARRLLPWILGICALGLGLTALRGVHRDEFTVLLQPRSVPYLVGAAAANLGGLLVGVQSWRVLLLDFGARLRPGRATRIYFSGLFGKFAPGPGWGLLAHIPQARELGIAPQHVVSAYTVSNVVVAMTGAGLGLVCLPGVFGAGVLLLVPAVALLGLLLLRASRLTRFIEACLRRLRRPVKLENNSARALRSSTAWGLASWSVSGLHLWLLALALGAPAWRSLPLCVGAFALGTVAGIAAVVVPDGLGVRDALVVAVLAQVLPLPSAVLAALASRVLCTLVEIAGGASALGAVALGRLLRPRLPRPSGKSLSNQPDTS